MNLNLSVVLEKMDQRGIKKREIKKRQKEPVKLKISILGRIVKRNQQLD